MLVSDIIAKVKSAIEDDSFANDEILSYINKGIGRVAAALPLPLLVTQGSVVCQANTTRLTLPDDYYSNLFNAHNTTKKFSVRIVRPFTNFLGRFPGFDVKGDVSHICVHGRTLYFQGSPTADQTLAIFYSSRPEQLAAGDEVEVIDEAYQEDLLVSFAAAECYKLIENGIEGTKVNYNKFMGDFTLAIAEYTNVVGLAEDTADFIPEEKEDRAWPSI